MTKDPNWFPVWALWALFPWLALHLWYDYTISKYLDARRKPGEPPPGKLFGFKRYGEIMRETARRYENGDTTARVVTYADWVMAAGFVLLVIYRVILIRVPS